MKLKQTLISLILLLFISSPALAIKSGELLEEDSKDISNYIMGLVDMLSYLEYVKKNDDRGECIFNWYYKTEEALAKIYFYMGKYPDKFPESIVIVLTEQACPPE